MLSGVFKQIPVFRFVLFLFLFSFVPLAIGYFLGASSFELEEKQRRQKSAKKLEDDVSAVLRRIDPKNYLQDRFQRFYSELFSRKITAKRIAILNSAARTKWKIAFDLYVFDNNGSLITPDSIKLRSRFVLQKIWDGLVKTNRFSPKKLLRYQKAISSLMGSDFDIHRVSGREGKLVTLQAKGEDAILYWRKDRSSRFSGIVFVAWKLPKHEEILNSFSRRKPHRGISLLANSSGSVWKTIWKTVPGIETKSKPDLFSELGKKWIFTENLLWFGSNFGNLRLLACREERGMDFSRKRTRLLVFSIFLGVVLGIFWFRWLVLKKDLYISIRVKLILLFLFSLIVPLMGVFFFGYQMLNDREEVLVQEKASMAKEILEGIDHEFLAEVQGYLKIFRELRNDPELLTNPKSVLEKAKKFVGEEKIVRYETRGVAGNTLDSTESQTEYLGIRRSFEAISKTCIQRYLPERWANLKEKPQEKVDFTSQMLLESPEIGFAHFLDRPDMVHTMHFGTNDVIWYWDVFSNPQYPIAFITMSQHFRFAASRYLNLHLARRFGAFRVVAWWTNFDNWYPKGFTPTSEMEDLMDRIRITLQPVFSKLKWEGKWYYAVGIPGSNLKGHGLLALVSEQEIIQKIASLRRGIGWGVLVALIVAVITGVALAENFLLPIQELSRGIEALTGRETSFRVAIYGKDELGDLSDFFNGMMEELREIQMARIVQEALLPKSLPVIPGFEIDLINISASDLGGDYFDVCKMKDGRILLVIGDVTGHGVSSALLMAMAKAVVFEFSELGDDDLTILLKRLNELIYRILHRKKLMTFFCAILEPETGKIQYSNAGHPFSFICFGAAEIRELRLIQKPLGFSIAEKNIQYVVQEETLKPGELLFVYTDGLVETQNPAGNFFGYAGLQQLLKRLYGKKVTETNRAILDELAVYRNSPEIQDDDLTFGGLRRI